MVSLKSRYSPKCLGLPHRVARLADGRSLRIGPSAVGLLDRLAFVGPENVLLCRTQTTARGESGEIVGKNM